MQARPVFPSCPEAWCAPRWKARNSWTAATAAGSVVRIRTSAPRGRSTSAYLIVERRAAITDVPGTASACTWNGLVKSPRFEGVSDVVHVLTDSGDAAGVGLRITVEDDPAAVGKVLKDVCRRVLVDAHNRLAARLHRGERAVRLLCTCCSITARPRTCSGFKDNCDSEQHGPETAWLVHGRARPCSVTFASTTVHHPFESRRKSNTTCTPSTLYSTTAFAREPSRSKLKITRLTTATVKMRRILIRHRMRSMPSLTTS